MDTFEIIKICVYLVFLVISIVTTGILVPAIKNYFKEKIGEVKFNKICAEVEKAVDTAEVLINESGLGERKNEYVTNTINDILKRMNYDFSEQEVNILIESAVKAMNDAKANKE